MSPKVIGIKGSKGVPAYSQILLLIFLLKHSYLKSDALPVELEVHSLIVTTVYHAQSVLSTAFLLSLILSSLKL